MNSAHSAQPCIKSRNSMPFGDYLYGLVDFINKVYKVRSRY